MKFTHCSVPLTTLLILSAGGCMTAQPHRTAPPQVAVAPGTKLVELKAAQFDFDRAVLKLEGKTRVDEAIRMMDRDPALSVSIEGHTDSVGSDAYNLQLGLRRVETVKTYMIREGISGSRIATHSFGESRKVASNGTAAGRSENRRVEIVAE